MASDLFLIGKVEDAGCRDLVKALVQGRNREFRLFINSEGGNVYDALSLCQLIKAHGRVDTICLGVALSGAADILAAGRRRYIVPRAVAMLHQVEWEMPWQFSSTLARNARFVERLNDMLADFLAEATGHTKKKILEDSRDDFYLYGEEIIRYHLADALWPPRPARRGGRIVSKITRRIRGRRR